MKWYKKWKNANEYFTWSQATRINKHENMMHAIYNKTALGVHGVQYFYILRNNQTEVTPLNLLWFLSISIFSCSETCEKNWDLSDPTIMPILKNFMSIDRMKPIAFQLQVMKYLHEGTKKNIFLAKDQRNTFYLNAHAPWPCSRPDHSVDLSLVIPNSTLPRFLDIVSQLSSSVFIVGFIPSTFVYRSARLDAGLTCVYVTKCRGKNENFC